MTSSFRHATRALTAGILVAAGLGLLAGTSAQAATDPLQQTLAPDEPTATGRIVLDRGHIDVGPRYQNGNWSIQLHTGAGPEAVWRQPADVVLDVTKAANLTIPSDPTYDFLHADAGTTVSVIPQTQKQDVVWVGWNTQDPHAMAVMDQGVTMNLRGVQGPGSVVVYLQSGNLCAPEVLLDSTKTTDQSIFVDTNTHTHANWVFSEPGNYLVDLGITATLVDGRTVADSEPIRFAVGTTGDPQKAFEAAYDERHTAASAPTSSAAVDSPPAGSIDGSLVAVVAGVGGGIVVLVIVLLGLLLARSSRARKRALAERAPTRGTESAS